MIPVNDNVWHHLGFVWSNTNGRWDVLVDGTPRAIRDSVKTGHVIPGGGMLAIGQKYKTPGFEKGAEFLGKISRVNIWDKALTGEEIEAMAQSRGDEEGNILKWFDAVHNIVGNIQVALPSNVQNTSKRSGCFCKQFYVHLYFFFVITSNQGHRGRGGQRGPWPPLSLRPVGKLEIWYFVGINFVLRLTSKYF